MALCVLTQGALCLVGGVLLHVSSRLWQAASVLLQLGGYCAAVSLPYPIYGWAFAL